MMSVTLDIDGIRRGEPQREAAPEQGLPRNVPPRREPPPAPAHPSPSAGGTGWMQVISSSAISSSLREQSLLSHSSTMAIAPRR